LADDGTVYSFGNNSDGQIGHGGDGRIAARITSGSSRNKMVTQVSAGSNHSSILVDDGTVLSFGNGSSGQTGLGTEDDIFVPTPIDMTHLDGKTITQLAAGQSHSLLLADDGTVFSFGSNHGGLTGQGTDDFNTLFPDPIDTTNIEDKTIIQIAAGIQHSLLLADDGTVFSFGVSRNGRTGLGTSTGDTFIATQIDTTHITDTKIVQVAAGQAHSLLLGEDGTVFSFGRNEFWSQTGQGTNVGDTLIATPIDMAPLEGKHVTQIATGGTSLHSLILTDPLAIPEPSSVALMIIGSIAAIPFRRSRHLVPSRIYTFC
jgi:alpha-tubulin suppressor-like RCC1 family protein